MSEKIAQLSKEVIKGRLKEPVRGSGEDTLGQLLEAEAEKLTQAARRERNELRQGYCSGRSSRSLTTTSGDVTLKVPKPKGISFFPAGTTDCHAGAPGRPLLPLWAIHFCTHWLTMTGMCKLSIMQLALHGVNVFSSVYQCEYIIIAANSSNQ